MDMIGWLVAFVILIGIEAATMALTTIWFAGGALFAFFVAIFGFSVKMQLVVFLAFRGFGNRFYNKLHAPDFLYEHMGPYRDRHCVIRRSRRPLLPIDDCNSGRLIVVDLCDHFRLSSCLLYTSVRGYLRQKSR